MVKSGSYWLGAAAEVRRPRRRGTTSGQALCQRHQVTVRRRSARRRPDQACIKSHLTDLSETCEDSVLTVAVTGKLCKSDVTRLCPGIVPGTGGIRACIKH